jgi:O-antigen biosynthesis protein
MAMNNNNLHDNLNYVASYLNNENLTKSKESVFLKFKNRKKSDDYKIVSKSILFDGEWYVNKYEDVKLEQMDPVEHYLNHGCDEMRDPGPFFSTSQYFENNKDVAQSGLNALAHYEIYGRNEGRKIFRRARGKNNNFWNTIEREDRRAIDRHIANFKLRPKISIVMPVYNTTPQFLHEAMRSVFNQFYSNWELCIANDASTKAHVFEILNMYAELDCRVKVVHRTINGNISAATNSALKLADGEFVALMDHDDVLTETALYEIVNEINNYPKSDLIYSDQDQVDDNGNVFGPYHKTSFDPELMLGHNMVNHLGVYRRSLLEKLGGVRIGFEGSQDYDLTLRVMATTKLENIRHIPEVLYHWRSDPDRQNFSTQHLDRCKRAAINSIQEYLNITSPGATVAPCPKADQFTQVKRPVPSPQPLVSIIVLTKDRADLMSKCADGILNHTDYQNIELLIVNHDSKEIESENLFKKLQENKRVRIIPYTGLFNFSKMNNIAANHANGTILALVNNDIEVIDSGWLNEMVSHAVRREVGAVGAKLYYPNGNIQHAGVVSGIGGVASHAFIHMDGNSTVHYSFPVLTRSVSIVTGACLVVRKEIYQEVGGLNDIDLPVAYNDVDFCLKVASRGYRNIWTPFAELIHHESVSRGHEDTPEKIQRLERDSNYMKLTWGESLKCDPFYNPNLTLDGVDYSIVPTRRPKPWSKYLQNW